MNRLFAEEALAILATSGFSVFIIWGWILYAPAVVIVSVLGFSISTGQLIKKHRLIKALSTFDTVEAEITQRLPRQ